MKKFIAIKNIINQPDMDRKILLVSVLIFFIIAFVLTFYFIFSTSVNQNQTRVSVSPTKYLLHNSLKSVSPANEAKNVGLYTKISATFANPVQLKSEVTLSLNPNIAGKIEWSGDNKTILLIPQKSLDSGKTYQAVLRFSEGKQAWSFTISAPQNVSEEDAFKNQVESDIKTAESLSNFYKSYPWWDKLPLKNDSYFIYFDPTQKKFTGLLYPKKGSESEINQQVSVLKNTIENSLQQLKINYSDYGIVWRIKPEP